MKRVLTICIAMTLGGCYSNPEMESAVLRAAAAAPDDVVGKTYYITRTPAQVCATPVFGATLLQKRTVPCFKVEKGNFTVTNFALEPGSAISKSYFVKLSDGRDGYIPKGDIYQFESQSDHDRRISAEAECKRKGGVEIGMTKAQVLASCFGKPERINASGSAGGLHEQLVYGNGTYIYLMNGKVTSWQQSQR